MCRHARGGPVTAATRFRPVLLVLRFMAPLALVLGLLGYLAVPLMDNLTTRWAVRDLDIRSTSLANAMQDPLLEYVPQKAGKRIAQLFNRAVQDERLYALGFCDPSGQLLYSTSTFPASLGCAARAEGSGAALVKLQHGAVHVADSTLVQDGVTLGRLVLVHDMSFIERRSATTRKYIYGFFALLALAISLVSVLVAHLSWRGWVSGVKQLLRGQLRPGASTSAPGVADAEDHPLADELRALLHEYRQEQQDESGPAGEWTADTLRQLLQNDLAGDEVLVVSNREPYIHTATRDGIVVKRPASGLVTAVEAVMRACSGTWIAHGAGSADHDTVDGHDHVAVPPEDPSYTLRRVWLSEEEEQGYYYGFANEGLWPLCHIAHVRPVFRSSDWEQYVKVNQRFADAVIAEAKSDNPVVLVQDYHFALLPRMVRAALPKATIITFWHIPWPNSESFGICPWREEIIDGLLGSTIVGFHTPFHRKNFLDTVDRYMESRIEPEASTVSYGGELTQVQRYPISIAWPEPKEGALSVAECRSKVREALGLPEGHLLGIGVDRFDYTKGIIERFQAVERMLELEPALVGKFTFVQIAAPTRSALDEYQNFEARVRAQVDRINAKYAGGTYLPIILKAEHHGQAQITEYFRASEVCMVTSLHDGMNLVSKEFIAARDDEQGVLILSQFTGAARELHEALIINPYHVEEGAAALRTALFMPAVEQTERMRSMRRRVKDFNVYRWAGKMLQDAARLRQRARVMSKIHKLHAHGKPRRVA
jgi:trehalose 6-phosphate synthase